MKKQWFTTQFWDEKAQTELGGNQSDQDRVLGRIVQFMNYNSLAPGEVIILPFTGDLNEGVGHFPVLYFAEKKIAWAHQDEKPVAP